LLLLGDTMTGAVLITDIDKIDRPITTDITTRSQAANAYGGNAA